VGRYTLREEAGILPAWARDDWDRREAFLSPVFGEHRWVVFDAKRVKDPDTGETITRKLPYVADWAFRCRKASCADPSTWRSFGSARECASAENPMVALALDGKDYFGIDIDHCLVGEYVCPTAQYLMLTLGGYWELSPSGTGLRAFVPRGSEYVFNRRVQIGRREVEIYGKARFLTYTGNRLESGPLSWPMRDALCQMTRPRDTTSVRLPTCYTQKDGKIGHRQTLDDVRALAIHWGHMVPLDLMDGVWRPHYPSQSSADLRLMSYLGFCTGMDADRTRDLFSESGLGQRKKWRDRPDYQDRLTRLVLQDEPRNE